MKSNRNNSSQIRLDAFNRILDSLNDLDSPVVVEGHSDTLALRSLGYHGSVIELNDGKSVLSTVEKLAQKLGTSGIFVIMTDWDRTGSRLAKRLKEYGESSDLVPDLRVRRDLSLLCSKDITCIEELPTMIKSLRKQL
ncbi:MAG TPA: toprim domain-containing protein [Candidatus Poseidoniia archaeon]|jgi:5S rRNA maturation endonuclease (ribonuclease M5)|nr:toprim domain-containing protein [Candidatus Poseidoniia archaeon]|tara:strand:- start:265 stop:678 length:414 start_codon:yes stop_codon:yes gene_type:complete